MNPNPAAHAIQPDKNRNTFAALSELLALAREEIAALGAENARMRNALEHIRGSCPGRAAEVAAAALPPKE